MVGGFLSPEYCYSDEKFDKLFFFKVYGKITLK